MSTYNYEYQKIISVTTATLWRFHCSHFSNLELAFETLHGESLVGKDSFTECFDAQPRLYKDFPKSREGG